MIEIARLDDAQWRQAVERPGGFCWWYVDLTTAEGDGLVLIWSLGLPFLAGSRELAPPSARPALNIAVYRRGRPDLYLLQEYAAEDVVAERPSGQVQMGNSTIDIDERKGCLVLRAELDEPVPGTKERVRGTIDLSGPCLELPPPTSATSHLWTPRIVHGHAQARLRFGETRWELEGAGYFDGNVSARPLTEQGIEAWRWGRLRLGNRTLVFYEVDASSRAEPRTSLVLEADACGGWVRREDMSLAWSEVRRGAYGIRAPRRLELSSTQGGIRCWMSRLVDDGPFYQRFLLEAEGQGVRGRGVYEVVCPDRIDRTWQRPFVRMRTHRVAQANSAWLPLFSGPQQGRAARLFRSWFSRNLREAGR